MDQNDFIGMGHNPNPNVPDIPEGFGAVLSREPVARINFQNLDDIQKTNVIRYIQSNNLIGNDAINKINQTVESLKNNSSDLFS